MKSCEEMVQSLLKRREQYVRERRIRRKRLAVGAFAACGLLALGAVRLLPGRESRTALWRKPEPSAAFALPEGRSGRRKTVEASSAVGSDDVREEGSEETRFFWWKKKLKVGGTLYRALKNDPQGTVTVTAVCSPPTAEITAFVFEGKTLADWAVAAYDETAGAEEKKGYEQAFLAYLDTVLRLAEQQLEAQGISCERITGAENGLRFSASAAALEGLTLDGLENWYFELAEENG